MLQNTVQNFFNIFFYLKEIYINNSVIFNLINNVIFILLLTLILIFIICTLLSNTYILFIFKTYLSIKNCIKTLNDINFFPTDIKFNNIKPVLFSQGYNSRSFSTYTNNNINEIENNNLDPDNLNSVNHNSDQSLIKQLKEFKKAYGGGYLGYTHIYNFGSVTQFTSYSSELEFEACRENLISKLKDYLYVIPETETYSILPVIRFEHSEKEYKSLSI